MIFCRVLFLFQKITEMSVFLSYLINLTLQLQLEIIYPLIGPTSFLEMIGVLVDKCMCKILKFIKSHVISLKLCFFSTF